jgi:hypothetical protein
MHFLPSGESQDFLHFHRFKSTICLVVQEALPRSWAARLETPNREFGVSAETF